MTGIIWYEIFQQGCDKLDEIIANYKFIKIEPEHIFKSKNRIYEVTFENGDVWSVAPLSEYSRGKCCNIGYIPSYKRESKEAMAIAYPCIKGLPYQAVNFY